MEGIEQKSLNIFLNILTWSNITIMVIWFIILWYLSEINVVFYLSNNTTIKISLYDLVIETLENQIKTLKYLPFLISLTIIVIIINLIGNAPYGYANTSSIVLCLGLSFSLWLSCFLIIVTLHNYKIFNFFIPIGTPLLLLPLLVFIETISYLSRSLSLGIRLFSNIVSGHILISLISNFLYKILYNKNIYIIVFIIVPFIIYLCLVGLELSVSLIQSYVFLLLVCCYLKDSIFIH